MAKQSLSGWNKRYRSFAFWWSVGFGAGLLRPAPGTWGSILGLGIGYFLLQLPYAAGVLVLGALLITVISIFAIGVIEKSAGVHDAPEIVIDEIAGQWLAMVPLAFLPYGWLELGLSFLLFRIFDIIKPWPIGPLDRKVSGGFGVMVDDLVAGVIAAAILAMLMRNVL